MTVPAGEGSVHTLTLTWPFQDDPGMFIQLGLARVGGDAADTCGSTSVYGIQVGTSRLLGGHAQSWPSSRSSASSTVPS